MTIELAAIAAAVAYLLGSIPSGVIAVRLIKGIDIRHVGSGRTGATNAYRAAGRSGLALTLAGDLLKGMAAVWVARVLMAFSANPGWTHWIEALAGVAAIAGHNWSIWLGFRGGAGTATTFGVVVAMNLYLAIGLAALTIGIIVLARMASVGSIAAAIVMGVALSIAAAIHLTTWAYVSFGVIGGLLTLWALKPNILRILSQSERQLTPDH
jgi:acyl phosphate:glycerol-3-phosphate acyltransferase